ncbi:MAG TPA: lytic transglycosylase domain-containing protein, partial [Anaeromyxobacteraceae bacterium]|nr:lytic transglycosylase domain-containing protein [Anaeromyxobacteraceae bacterium]
MRRPGLRGCTGAFIALGVALAVMAFPRSVADRPQEHGVQAWVAQPDRAEPARAPRPPRPERPRIDAGFKPVPIATLDRMLERKMPDADPEDRLRLAEAILDEARHAAVDPFFVFALIAVESGFEHDAESHRGARGLMQLLPSTLESEIERSEIEGEIDDPVTHVRAGMRYYRRLLRAFGSHDVALMAYNAGPNRILKYLKQDAP